MNIDNDIECKKWLYRFMGNTNNDITLIISRYGDLEIDLELLMQAVEKINTSSRSVYGKRLYISLERDCFLIMYVTDIGNDKVMKHIFFDDYNGMLGALKEAIYYIYRESMK